MTIPPTSAAPGSSAAPADEPNKGLGWLLEDFLAQVPGTQAAFLVSRDGLVLAAAGLTPDEADRAAAVSAAQYSSAGAAGAITSTPAGRVRQVIIQHDTQFTILMSTPDQHPNAAAATAGPAAVGCVLGVLAEIDAHTALVGDRMAALIVSVARHLVTATRTTGSVGTTRLHEDGSGEQ